MRPKSNQTLNLKLLILGLFLSLLLIFVLRSDFYSSSNQDLSDPSSSHTAAVAAVDSSNGEKEKSTTTTTTTGTRDGDCSSLVFNKIPASLAQALIHYTTSTITPQQTLKEISVTARVLEKRSPCNFLVFGLGHDSLMWSSLNHGSRTVFLEEDEAWIEQIKHRFPMLESYHVTYESKVNEAEKLMEVGRGRECREVWDPRDSKCQLALKGFPSEIYETQWDLIMVDAPTGYHDEAPGRMTAIYTAGLMARTRDSGEAHVFVHDVNREVEDKFSKEFLCENYMRKQEGRLRHFTIPSYNELDRPFCPP